ncbi:PQQ-dependent sugar dehydrogenase [Halomarina halobia]|uniref:PQQ-dependent sugar dehydrogenase n=1 Tax=Halomarina halobia TaxID=3033386 RepID=A0ABD6A8P4_9EURY|nr:PQQ-dependent sugar dehydrogenase [Halomarina sp. PSR21]
MNRRRYLGATAGVVAGLTGCLDALDAPGDDSDGDGGDDGSPSVTAGDQRVVAETVAAGLEVPWGVAYRDGVLHLTERPGRVVRVADGRRQVVADLADSTAAEGEGGLLGLAFHPDDPDAATAYQTYDDGGLTNRIIALDAADGWSFEPLFDGIPGAPIHDGGRLLVRDGSLYATTGDAADEATAQDVDSLGGKVLRLTLDGEPHPDNPFGGAVFTYGHRNPQGLALLGGELYSTEHGPDTDDEINRLEAGGNYGWPEATGPSDSPEFVDPLASYTPTIAPGGAVVYPEDGAIEAWRGDLLFGTLVGQHLHRSRIRGDEVTEDERLFEGTFGRLRTTFIGADGHLHVVTSNRDGRGDPREGDDRIVRVRPE